MNKEILKEVIADNQIEISNYQVIERDFNYEEFGNYVFVGIRRAGKSFLIYQRIQQLLKSGTDWDEMLYVNFEDERLIGMKLEDLNLLLEVHLEMYDKKPTLFLDEIQNIDGWEKFARRLADSKYRVYITGSNAKMLSSEIQSTLGGRYIAVNVFPYDFPEFLNANNVNFDSKTLFSTKGRAEVARKFNDYFYFGGFPEGATLPVKRNYLTSVYQKIFLGDIVARHSVDNTFALKLMFKKLAESVKTPISHSRLANIVSSAGSKIGTNTIIKYLDYAKDAWLVSPIQNMASKLVEKETNPKYYFTDNGILNLFLLDGNTALLENLVAITLLRKFGREDAVFFFNQNIEVDFYIPEIKTAIQVCYNLDKADGTFDREVGALQKIQKVLACENLLIITHEEEKTIEIDNNTIKVVPIWKWLLENHK
ncbi:MAG: ATP-binding protein [Bacteroidetes bacterium]|nr:ATP-binding protein [Bacteroidota bacterium]